MIKRSYRLISPVTLGLLAGIGLSGAQLNAQQQSDPQQAPPPAQQQTAPDSQSPSQSQQGQVQTFRRNHHKVWGQVCLTRHQRHEL